MQSSMGRPKFDSRKATPRVLKKPSSKSLFRQLRWMRSILPTRHKHSKGLKCRHGCKGGASRMVLHALQYIKAMQKEIQKLDMEIEAIITGGNSVVRSLSRMWSQPLATGSSTAMAVVVVDNNPGRTFHHVEVKREDNGGLGELRIQIWCDKTPKLVQEIIRQLELFHPNYIRLNSTPNQHLFNVEALVDTSNNADQKALMEFGECKD